MKIINLIENTKGAAACASAHGLSFYVETSDHKLLVDLGPSAQTLKNAEKLGIDLKAVDTVILSHGHYDHSGGIMEFAKINPHAPIFMQRSADGNYYADDGKLSTGERLRSQRNPKHNGCVCPKIRFGARRRHKRVPPDEGNTVQ